MEILSRVTRKNDDAFKMRCIYIFHLHLRFPNGTDLGVIIIYALSPNTVIVFSYLLAGLL